MWKSCKDPGHQQQRESEFRPQKTWCLLYDNAAVLPVNCAEFFARKHKIYTRIFYHFSKVMSSNPHKTPYISLLQVSDRLYFCEDSWENWLRCNDTALYILLPHCGLVPHIDGLVQDYSNSIGNALELLQSCTEQSIYVRELDSVIIRFKLWSNLDVYNKENTAILLWK